jgi:lipopolysaccharide transport system permease protein
MQFRFFWRQVSELTVASLKSRYRKTWAGFLWVILNPLLQFGVQGLVFKKFLRLEIPDYYLFLLGGLLPWVFISQTVQMSTPVFVSSAPLLRSFRVDPLVIIGSQILDNFINFLMSFVLLLLPFYLGTDRSSALLLLLPVAFVPLLIGTIGLSVFLSTLNVFFRDTNFVMGFIFSLLFFLTPIFYPREYVPMEWQWLIDVNPLLYLIDPFRALVHSASISEFGVALVKSTLVALGLGVAGIILWKRKRNAFYSKL